MGRKYSAGDIGVFLAIVFTAMLFSSVARAAVVYSGKLTFIQGVVEIGRQGSPVMIPAKLGDSLFEGDNLKTRDASRAAITFLDNSVMHVSANSSMRIGRFIYDKAAEKRHVSVQTFGGAFRIM